jgi:7,8-didemethyl-8-hydroxy-5-deazariboflavin synthase CofG subunit
VQEVIVQNFRVKPGIPMRAWPESSRGEMLRALAVARLVLGNINIQAPPNLSSPDFGLLLDGGINDWGGVSPLTPDFINPEAPWPEIEELERRTAERGQELRARLTVYPEYVDRVVARAGLLGDRLRAAADELGYARRAA